MMEQRTPWRGGDPGAVEALWRASAARWRASQDATRLRGWVEHHRRLAGVFEGIAADHRARAEEFEERLREIPTGPATNGHASPKKPPAREVALEALREGDRTFSEWLDATGLSSTVLRQLRRELLAEGAVFQAGRVYVLMEGGDDR